MRSCKRPNKIVFSANRHIYHHAFIIRGQGQITIGLVVILIGALDKSAVPRGCTVAKGMQMN